MSHDANLSESPHASTDTEGPPGLAKGRRVRVSIEGNVYHESARVMSIRYGGPERDAHRTLSVAMDQPGVTVEYLAPEEWPPKPGQTWQSASNRVRQWFALDRSTDGHSDLATHLIDADGCIYDDEHFDRLLSSHAPWILVHDPHEKTQ
ncbi:hypothetical protein ACWEN6_13815 [Sphaerisporangium sp. NPDC004334]